MTDQELSAVLLHGLFASTLGPDDVAHFRHRAAIKLDYSLPKSIQPASSSEQDEDEQSDADHHVTELFSRFEEDVEQVLACIRLAGGGRTRVPGMLHFRRDWFHQDQDLRVEFLGTGSRDWRNRLTLDESQCQEVADMFRSLRSNRVRSQKVLVRAIRRFSSAVAEEREDEKIVDLMIAAESLFLGDAGSSQDRGELKYRLAIRSAFFLEGSPDGRYRVFTRMRSAYDARSMVVHGGEPGKLKDVDGSNLSLRRLTRLTEQYMRSALKKAIGVAPAKGPVVDWERLILG